MDRDITYDLQSLCYELESAGDDMGDCNLIRRAIQEIEYLRECLQRAEDMYAEELREIRATHVDDSVCGMCIQDADHGVYGYANECAGFAKDDCFQLNREYYRKCVFDENK